MRSPFHTQKMISLEDKATIKYKVPCLFTGDFPKSELKEGNSNAEHIEN